MVWLALAGELLAKAPTSAQSNARRVISARRKIRAVILELARRLLVDLLLLRSAESAFILLLVILNLLFLFLFLFFLFFCCCCFLAVCGLRLAQRGLMSVDSIRTRFGAKLKFTFDQIDVLSAGRAR